MPAGGDGTAMRRAKSARLRCQTPSAAHERRIDAHAERVAREQPRAEWPACWGCGAPAPRLTWSTALGWVSRPIRIGRWRYVELHCPECFAAHGWIEPAAGAA